MGKANNSLLKKIVAAILSLGPAFYVVGYTIGTGSIVTMASAGSKYGMAMIWALLLACISSYVLLRAYGRYTIVTGEGALYGIKKHIKGGKYISVILLISLVFVEVLALIGIMGIVTDLIHSWTAMLYGGEGWNVIMVAVVIIVLIYGVLLLGNFTLFEKILIVFVAIMGISFLMTLFVTPIDIADLTAGFIPSIPEGANTAILLAAIVGTTFTAPTFVVRGILMKEKKWDLSQLKHSRKDALQGVVMMFLISGSVMLVAANTLFPRGISIDEVVVMVRLLEPLLGRFANSIFVVGIIGAALSSIIPILMLAPLLLSDYKNTKVKYKGKSFRIISALVLLSGLLVPLFGARPIEVMIFSQVFQVFILPIVVIAMWYLINRKDLLKENVAGSLMNVGFVFMLLFTFVITYVAIVGLIELLSAFF